MKPMMDIPDNEEAIKKLEELCEYKGYNYTVITDKDVESLHMAIETLKNEPFLIDALHKAHAEIKEMDKHIEELNEKRPQDEWSLVERKKNIDLVCPHCGYHRCNLAYGFSIEEVRKQIKEDKSNDYLLPDFCERCGAKLGFGGNKE